MLLRWSRPWRSTDGTISTTTSRDITQLAINGSRYCTVRRSVPVAPGRGARNRAETPIRGERGTAALSPGAVAAARTRRRRSLREVFLDRDLDDARLVRGKRGFHGIGDLVRARDVEAARAIDLGHL